MAKGEGIVMQLQFLPTNWGDITVMTVIFLGAWTVFALWFSGRGQRKPSRREERESVRDWRDDFEAAAKDEMAMDMGRRKRR
jgi:hypothetical protein